MVTGYNLYLDEDTDIFNKYISIGEQHLSTQKVKVTDDIEKYIINGVADGTKIEKDWFPKIEADIFISHSHTDENLAKGLAGWLYNSFKLKCFVDSCIWGYADNLLEMINNKYSDKENTSDGEIIYNHQKCNTASKHVNTMLTIALHKMIDKAEVAILLNTKNSILGYRNVYKDATYSPWIYSEIVCTEIVRKKSISEYREEPVCESFLGIYDEFSATYRVSLEHLKSIDRDILSKWKELYDKKNIKYPLDYLYKLIL